MKLFVCVILLAQTLVIANAHDLKAECDLQGSVSGKIRLAGCSDGGSVTVEGTLSNISLGKHGFHVHQEGKLGNGCVDAGPHFNPHKALHGDIKQDASSRHVGDWSNLDVSSDPFTFKFTDHLATLSGNNSIMGRAIVVHEGTDDLGLGGNEESTKTGNAGKRLACCVITKVQ